MWTRDRFAPTLDSVHADTQLDVFAAVLFIRTGILILFFNHHD